MKTVFDKPSVTLATRVREFRKKGPLIISYTIVPLTLTGSVM